MIKDIIPKLKGHIPDTVYQQLPDTCVQFGIDGPKRLANLLGQAKHESAKFTVTHENLNYSADGLVKVFRKYFPTKALCEQYAHHPEQIANRVYANRLGNGDEASGDGWKHRGMGYLQTTGKDNQGAFFLSVGLPANSDPELIASTYPLASAAYFFKNNGLWVICDHGTDFATVSIITKIINGGQLGITDRVSYTQEFYNILTT